MYTKQHVSCHSLGLDHRPSIFPPWLYNLSNCTADMHRSCERQGKAVCAAAAESLGLPKWLQHRLGDHTVSSKIKARRMPWCSVVQPPG